MGEIKLTANILFSGIGCQEYGIKATGLFDLEVKATSEIDTNAVISYAAIHNGLTPEMIATYPDYPDRSEMAQDLERLNIGYDPKKNKGYDWQKLAGRAEKPNDLLRTTWLACKLNHNMGDISRIEELPEADLWTISSPCQDISVAGKLRGLNPDDETRSSLIWQNVRLLKKAIESGKPPKFMLLENVKNLVGKKFKADFDTFNDLMGDYGYNVYWKVLNASDCGLPQNRERVFAIYIRKDIDTGMFTFPKPFDNGMRLKDVLEDGVDEKYYINTPKAQDLINKLEAEGKL